jgi:hypothetical protein
MYSVKRVDARRFLTNQSIKTMLIEYYDTVVGTS